MTSAGRRRELERRDATPGSLSTREGRASESEMRQREEGLLRFSVALISSLLLLRYIDVCRVCVGSGAQRDALACTPLPAQGRIQGLVAMHSSSIANALGAPPGTPRVSPTLMPLRNPISTWDTEYTWQRAANPLFSSSAVSTQPAIPVATGSNKAPVFLVRPGRPFNNEIATYPSHLRREQGPEGAPPYSYCVRLCHSNLEALLPSRNLLCPCLLAFLSLVPTCNLGAAGPENPVGPRPPVSPRLRARLQGHTVGGDRRGQRGKRRDRQGGSE